MDFYYSAIQWSCPYMKHEKDSRANALSKSVKLSFLIFFILGIYSAFQDRILMFFIRSDIHISHFRILLTSRMFFSILFSVIITAVIIVSGYFFLIRPLRQLSIAAKKIAKGDFSVRIAEGRKNKKKDFLDLLFEDFNSMTEELSSLSEKLKALSVTDELTKLDNRRSFSEYINVLWKQNHRLHLPITVLLIDIDCFKKYNDSLGHLEGDKALVAVAQCLKGNVKRESDFIARFGGEEFVCLLPFINKNEAFEFAKGLVQSVEDMKIHHPNSECSKYLTISVGMANVIPDENNDYNQLLDEADKALYCAKEAGRNRVVVN